MMRQDNLAKALHNTSSLLLKLPQEIKDQIYFYVCGGQLLHIHVKCEPTPQRLIPQLFHHLCQFETPNAHGQELSKSAAVYGASHGACCPYRNGMSDCLPHHHNSSGRLNLSFLRTCTQLCKEARGIPYTLNFFSFDCHSGLEEFLRRLPEGADVRNVRLDIHTGWLSPAYQWNRSLSLLPVKMPRLQGLCIYVMHNIDWLHDLKPINSVDKLTLAMLPLKELQVRDVDVRYECDCRYDDDDRAFNDAFSTAKFKQIQIESLECGRRWEEYATGMLIQDIEGVAVEQRVFWPKWNR